MANKPKRKTRIVGYLVEDRFEEYTQFLGMDFSEGTPKEGVLEYNDNPYLFPDRKSAREAITRSLHYYAAFGKRFCEKECLKILAAVQAAE